MLRVSDLSISIGTPADFIDIVSSGAFEIGRGEMLGVGGESGSGKWGRARSILGLCTSRHVKPSAGRIL